jgi:membrane protein implicated in regulation of membrane protease activity
MSAEPESVPPERSAATPERASGVTPARVVIALCLLAPFAGILWVGSYARTEPTLAGVPFFYWYQMLWVPLSAALTTIAYRLLRREKNRGGRTTAGGAR